MTKECFVAELERVLELAPGSVRGAEPLADLHWDSMSAIMFIAMADEKFGAKIAPERLTEAKTVEDLHNIINQN
jgi:acyl carrier protein